MQDRRKSWLNIVFLSLTPVIGVVGTAAYAIAFGVRWWEPALLVVLFGLVSFSVTAGYHRCFAHKAYACHPIVQAFYLFFGAMALQNSALKWSSDHRDHHRYVDKDWDPYSIKRGGLWAHILWLFYTEPPERTYDNVPDLQANRLVRWQFRLNGPIGLIAGLGIPTLIGAFFGRPIGGLLWGGFLRIALIHHTTFLVNSVAHIYGTRPYTEENSGRDNALLAFFTNGEGYHNFHHKFPADFRNGVRWYQWDPTKWLIALLGFAGLATDLRQTPKSVIEKTRLRMLAKVEARRHQIQAAIGTTGRTPVAGAPRSVMHAASTAVEIADKRRDRRFPAVLASALLVAFVFAGVRISVARAAETASVGVNVTMIGGFYDELAPYGRWVDCRYGQCWVPAQVAADWQPYSNGQWIYTEYGWTWVSNDPWGGSPYHYGTWTSIEGHGWSWVPGTVWAPAWVTWSYSDDYVGWAPLPPTLGFGASGYVGRPIVVSRTQYVFVPANRFVGRNVAAVRVPAQQSAEIFRQTRPVTRLAVTGGIVRNTALPMETIERAAGGKMETRSIQVAGTAPRAVSAGTAHLAVVAPAREMRAAAAARPQAVSGSPKPSRDNPSRQAEASRPAEHAWKPQPHAGKEKPVEKDNQTGGARP